MTSPSEGDTNSGICSSQDVRLVYVSRSLIDVADATETVANYNVCDLPFGMMDTHADLVTM